MKDQSKVRSRKSKGRTNRKKDFQPLTFDFRLLSGNEDHAESPGQRMLLAKFSRAAFADLVGAHGARGAGRSDRARAFHGARPSRLPQSGAGPGQAAASREGIGRAGGRAAERS